MPIFDSDPLTTFVQAQRKDATLADIRSTAKQELKLDLSEKQALLLKSFIHIPIPPPPCFWQHYTLTNAIYHDDWENFRTGNFFTGIMLQLKQYYQDKGTTDEEKALCIKYYADVRSIMYGGPEIFDSEDDIDREFD